MLHDVVIETHRPGEGSQRHTVTVDADGGDDAAAKGGVEAAAIAAAMGGAAWKIIGVAPSVPGAPEAPAAALEGEGDPAVPDELEPPKRRR